MDDFMIRSLAAGVGVALAAGPLGSFVVWRRMAFFGDALSHSALLGVVFGMILGINHTIGIVILAVLFSFFIAQMQRQKYYSTDTILGIMAHGSLAFGLVAISLQDGATVNLMGFLFGDILATSMLDIIWIYAGLAVTLGVMFYIWRPLLLSTINADLAKVEGGNVDRVRFGFMLMISLLVALSIKIVGILLVTSLLVIPAAAARNFSNTPEKMAIMASLIGALSVVLGLFASLQYDIPSGPAIVVAAVILFILSALRRRC